MKLLHLDIETAPNLAYCWGLWDQNISINQIVEPGYTLCYAAKWHDKKRIIFDSIQESEPKEMIQRAWELLDKADAVVHYNGSKFDIPTLNREFISCNLKPPTPFAEVDLLKTVRRRFKFPSNKLDYVAQHLGLGGKVQHKGMDMWRDCMDGCPKAWKKMKQYNRQDVVLLEKLYNDLIPWIPNHPNWGVYVDPDKKTCRNCGSTNIKKNGIERKTTLQYQRYKCNSCGANLQSRTRLAPAREGVLK